MNASSGGRGEAVVRTPVKSGRSWVFSVVATMLLLACGALSYQVWSVGGKLSATENELADAVKRIDQLSHEVFATGSSVTESGTAIEKKFKFFDSEIRKLWDVSNKRNKAAIKKNTGQVQSLNSSLKKNAAQIKSGETKLSALEKQQVEFNTKLKQINNQLLAENTTLRATLEDHSEQLLLLRGELELMQSRLQGVPADLAKRVAVNEEAIEAIDATRRQLISNITQLQNRLNQLQAGTR